MSKNLPTWGGRPDVESLPLHDVDASAARFELSDNTNPAGAPPAALRVLREVTGPVLSHYPTTYSTPLRAAIAEFVDVDVSQIVVGCGSDELIDCAFRALVAPGGRVVYTDPTFLMARVFAVANGLEAVPVPFAPGFDLDIDALCAARPSLIYLCTPNNPTGTVFSASRLDSLLERFDGFVVVDEAYAEYVDAPITPRAPSLERVLSLRTLSKAWGLAGLRVGYAVGSRQLIELVKRVRGPFKLTAPSERAALAALQEDGGWMREHVAIVLAARARFSADLCRIGYAPLPSQANFVLVPMTNPSAVAEQLLLRDVAVRVFRNLTGIGDALRITVGPPEAMERVLQVLAQGRA
ncbi:MAG: histidinol-phosphate transaminase [Gemmatimonadaceae bacterium]